MQSTDPLSTNAWQRCTLSGGVALTPCDVIIAAISG